jgi:hypothetical protein
VGDRWIGGVVGVVSEGGVEIIDLEKDRLPISIERAEVVLFVWVVLMTEIVVDGAPSCPLMTRDITSRLTLIEWRPCTRRSGTRQLAQTHDAIFNALIPSVPAAETQTMTKAAAGREHLARDKADPVL